MCPPGFCVTFKHILFYTGRHSCELVKVTDFNNTERFFFFAVSVSSFSITTCHT